MTLRNDQTADRKPWKLVLWTALAGLIFGLIGFGEIAEDWLRVARNEAHKHPASGEFVIVKIDDPSLQQVGNWPWPRKVHAQLIDRLTAAGAKKIVFDINFSYPSDPAQDEALAKALRRSGKVTLAARTRSGQDAGQEIESPPLPMFSRHADVATISLFYNYQLAVWRLPYAANVDGKSVPSLSAATAELTGPVGEHYPIDYSIDADSVPTISASKVLKGEFPQGSLRGKDVFIGTDSDILGDRYFIPGYGQVGGVLIHAIGAETLKSGHPVNLGWLPPFLLALSAILLAALLRNRVAPPVALLSAIAILLFGPIPLESRLVFVDVTPGLFILLVYGGTLLWRRYRNSGTVNIVSGLPNLNALRHNRAGRNEALVAARILNYEEALAALPPGSERPLVEQIIARLSVGSSERVIYQGDSGIFAWFADPRHPFGNHLEALHALFRNPARVNDLSVDLSVAFGVEVGSKRSLETRLASGLVAADQAARDGLKWCYHDPDTLEDASWRLSILSQLDAAIEKGEVWIAYQPKLDLKTKRIVGAEALARWTHPEKGPIAASEFVAAAEANNRIAKLTDFVLEQAVKAAADINRDNAGDFEIAVNMSARLMSDKHFLMRLSAVLARHGLAPRNLTLELTETAALASAGEGLALIGQLRDLGVRISIDDYGTGLSTLDYLKRVPANEIKIDQSFVKGVADNRSDRLMVHSTIQLAHSLGRRVVAEGVEQREIVDVLVELDCDIGQGFALGRPMSLETLVKRLIADRKRSVA